MTPGLDQPCRARPADGIPSGVQKLVREPQFLYAMIPHAGLSPRPDGDAANAEEQGRPQSVKGIAMDLIGVIIAGIIIGLLGKFFAPGNRDNIPLWLTVVCGIGGVLIGYYLAAALGFEATPASTGPGGSSASSSRPSSS